MIFLYLNGMFRHTFELLKSSTDLCYSLNELKIGTYLKCVKEPCFAQIGFFIQFLKIFGGDLSEGLGVCWIFFKMFSPYFLATYRIVSCTQNFIKFDLVVFFFLHHV